MYRNICDGTGMDRSVPEVMGVEFHAEHYEIQSCFKENPLQVNPVCDL